MKLIENIREYGRLMRSAGMDAASDFADRRADGVANEAEAAALLAVSEKRATGLFNALQGALPHVTSGLAASSAIVAIARATGELTE